MGDESTKNVANEEITKGIRFEELPITMSILSSKLFVSVIEPLTLTVQNFGQIHTNAWGSPKKVKIKRQNSNQVDMSKRKEES